MSPLLAQSRRSTTSKNCGIFLPSSSPPSRARYSDTHYQCHDSPPLSPPRHGSSPTRSTSYPGKHKPSRFSTLKHPPQPDSLSEVSNTARGPPRAPTPPPAADIRRRSTIHYETQHVSRSPPSKTKPQTSPEQKPEDHASTPKFNYNPPPNAMYTEWPVGGYTLPQEEPVTIPITPAPWNGNLSRISRYRLIECLMVSSRSKRSFEETKKLVDKQFALHAPIYWSDGRRSQSKYEIDEEDKKHEQEMKVKSENKV